MGFQMRHYCALMKKNWIIWRRTLVASLFELFCPVALMAILVIARSLVEIDKIEAKSNIGQAAFFSPVDYLQVSNQTEIAYLYAQIQYSQFLNFTGVRFDEVNHLVRFLPYGCMENGASQARPVIAYAGKKSLTSKVVKSLKDVQRSQLILINTFNATSNATSDQNMQQMIELVKQAVVSLEYREFESPQAIIDYINSDDYMQISDHPGICFGFSIQENGQSDYEAKLIFNDHRQEAEARMIPTQLQSAWSPYNIKQDSGSYNLYTRQGYSYLQNFIANEILREKTGIANASIAMTYVPFKSDEYLSDDFESLMSNMLSLFLLLIYILPVYRLISNIVSEKETKARESMKMMGLTDMSYWLSWFTYYSIVVTLITLISLGILYINVFKTTNFGYMFLFFWIYGISLFGFSILITSFFSNSRTAAISGTLLYFGSSFIDFIVFDPSISMTSKNFASLLTTVAISRGCDNIGLFEANKFGVNSETLYNEYNNYRLVDCLYIMVVSFVITLLLGLYLENVLPSSYGLRKPWYFCLTKSFWGCDNKRKGRSSRKIKKGTINNRNTIKPQQEFEQSSQQLKQQDDIVVNNGGDVDDPENQSLFEAKNQKNKENFEGPSREMMNQEQEDKILKITELKKIFSNGFAAVKGLNIKMYNNQIFALLGHNGAGKTTTISMLTGLLEASSGAAEIFGYDLFEDMNEVRNFMGVCPQHDVLFDLLTPEEHLDIFCDFKGLKGSKREKFDEINKMLVDVDLVTNRNTIAKNLSGGNKRKLSVAIALIGGSKLVLLDEPTSGMDLSVRRRLWNMLKSYKNNRIIILTTHYMDEADILGDRIGIMAGGQLVCLGSSLFLKNRFGVGYNLTMVKLDKSPNTQIDKYLKENIGDEVKKLSEVSSEITYQIPSQLSYKFKDFFIRFDKELEQLGIRSYGISVTTLEEVFLRVGHLDDDNNNHDAISEKKEGPILENEKEQEERLNEYSISSNHETGRFNLFGIHLDALFRKRLNLYKRNFSGLLVEIFIPIILVLIGLGFQQITFYQSAPERPLVPSHYPYAQRLLINDNFTIQTAGQTYRTSDFFNNLPERQDAFQATYKNYSAAQYRNNLSAIIPNYDQDIFNRRLEQPYEPFRFGSYFIYQADKKRMDFKVVNFLNITSQDVTALYPQFMYESILKVATSNTNFKFKVTTSPYPITINLRQRAKSQNGVLIVFVVAVGFALIPAAVISNIVNEREKNLKHMQMISGMNLTAYWISNIIFDIVKAIIPCVVSIGMLYAFDIKYDNVWIMFLLYPFGVIPFTYAMSFCFNSENLAQTITIFLHFVISGIGCIVAAILRIIESTYDIGDILSWVFMIVPSDCLTNAIVFTSSKDRVFQLRPELQAPDFDLSIMGGYILAICGHGALWTIMLILIEVGAFKFIEKLYARIIMRNIQQNNALKYDEDVIEEEQRVEQIDQKGGQLQVRVDKFRKIYTSLTRKAFLAVEKTSFGLEYGECFALLGVNGAGKTTTFKSLTGEIVPTSGSVTINGMDIIKEFDKVRKLIGYCPQHDCIFPLMSVEEHLWYYARIKGIKREMRQSLVEKQIKEMNLEEHRHKPAGTLSGGNKRKLSVAICVLGNPPIILLDEPSAGMDPEARRFMWSVVAKISQQRKQSAVILTTHSMEEAEALSTKMGIMVKGGIFRCFGSSQHIKSKFGTGFEVEVKIRKQKADEIAQSLSQFNLESNKKLTINEIQQLLNTHNQDPILIEELRKGGLGNDLILESEDTKGYIQAQNYVQWLYIEQQGLKIIQGLAQQFPECEVLEHYNDYYKFRVPRGALNNNNSTISPTQNTTTIGYIFSFIENNKEQLNISEYSAQQTTLEQIFQAFANQSVDKLQSNDANMLLRFKVIEGKVIRNTNLTSQDNNEKQLKNEIQQDSQKISTIN